MLIQVIRHVYNGTNTIGRMLIDGKFFAHTLEDVYRELKSKEDKIKGKTAIPNGRYKVILSMSNRFKKELPEILNVPYFTGIRIHSGNTEKDTEGCILVGANTDEKKIWNCSSKMSELIKLLKEHKGEVTIEISQEFKMFA